MTTIKEVVEVQNMLADVNQAGLRAIQAITTESRDDRMRKIGLDAYILSNIMPLLSDMNNNMRPEQFTELAGHLKAHYPRLIDETIKKLEELNGGRG